MLFCSSKFLYFFAAVFAVYWLLPWPRVRVLLLLAASIYFYSVWNKWLAFVVVASAMMDYLIALGLDSLTRRFWRRLLLAASLCLNLGILIYFKYCNFFLRSLEDALRGLGMEASLPVLAVLLPIGISFYTFEAINYTVDVYQRRMKAERNPLNFLLFILFFPHLIAGPIVRARDFLPRVAWTKRWNWMRANLGGRLILLGLMKKLTLADRMIPYVDPVFANPGAYDSATLWLAAFAYALQLYGDFSGYSDMAIGLAHLLGYKLAPNFNMPYLSPNMGEFWRRWHVSLSLWIRDYVFIPLGGSRGGGWRTGRNLLITMTLCGLWHGAAWNFVLFGFVQGVILFAHRGFRSLCSGLPGVSGALESAPGTVFRVACTFSLFCFTLVIFRCPTLSMSWQMMTRMLSFEGGQSLPLHPFGLWLTFAVVLACHLTMRFRLWERFFLPLPVPVKGVAYAATLTLTLLLAPDVTKAYIYFQF